MPTERALQAHIVKSCGILGILCYKFSSPSQRGVPDLLLLYKGNCCFIEVKSPSGKGKLSKMQAYQIQRIGDHGVDCYVVSSKERVNKVLAHFRHHPHPTGSY